jgi:hypothetical protein
MHEIQNPLEQEPASGKGPLVVILGGMAITAAVAVAFWPVWKEKSFEFDVVCPSSAAPEVTSVSLNNDDPLASITCSKDGAYYAPLAIDRKGPQALSHSDRPEFILTLHTSHMTGRIQPNHLQFTISKDPQLSDTTDVAVNSSDLVFIDDAYVSNQPSVHAGIDYTSPGGP